VLQVKALDGFVVINLTFDTPVSLLLTTVHCLEPKGHLDSEFIWSAAELEQWIVYYR